MAEYCVKFLNDQLTSWATNRGLETNFISTIYIYFYWDLMVIILKQNWPEFPYHINHKPSEENLSPKTNFTLKFSEQYTHFTLLSIKQGSYFLLFAYGYKHALFLDYRMTNAAHMKNVFSDNMKFKLVW